MNIVQPVLATVNTVAPSPEFIVAVYTPAIAEFISPFMLGVLDAERGELCVPEMYYTRLGESREYAEGYESVVGRTLLSDQIMGRPRMLTEAEMQAEADDYADYVADKWGGASRPNKAHRYDLTTAHPDDLPY